ncbi:MAG: hypothetical protein L6R48_01255 [Planctomycetes bacterium]|nr:hypothetical protein [Planctomycetota bacterium]
MAIRLPPLCELDKLAELAAQVTGLSLQYQPAKLKGQVRISVQEGLTAAGLWEVFNQALLSQGFTTVISGNPAVYQVVALTEAPALAVTATAGDGDLTYPPGFSVMVRPLQALSADAAVKMLGAVFTGQISQVRTFGGDDRRIVIAAPRPMQRAAEAVLAAIDRPGLAAEVRPFRPQRTGPAALQAAATAAWGAVGRIGASARPVEIQVAPDGSQLLLIATAETLPDLERLVQNLDRSEPSETRSYRPRYFGIEEVANLLQQLLRTEKGAPAPEIIRDKLTSSLVVRGSAEQHRRVEEFLKTLDEAPPAARRQVRTVVVKHRRADEMAKVLAGMIASGAAGAEAAGTTGGGAAQPAAPTQPAAQPAPAPGSAPSPARPGGATTVTMAGAETPVVLNADIATNVLIILGDPRAIDQVVALASQLDQRQPQVEIEVILVVLSNTDTRTLGVELAGQSNTGGVSRTVSSLFGLSDAGPISPGRVLPVAATGASAVVLNPGDYAAVVRALQTKLDARAVVRTRVVVNNNAKAVVNGVEQQPLTSSNSNSTVATTSISGTTDAGTQVSVSPQISSADYITLSYDITESTFLGQATITSTGTVIPPAKRADTLSSVATIPDGFTVALGGLSHRNTGLNRSAVPWIGDVPLLGALFRNDTDSNGDSRFFIFIRANVLRHATFADLRRRADAATVEAGLADEDGPRPEPQILR